MAKVRRTASAELDLENIVHHIALDDGRPAAAEKVARELVKCCDDLAELATKARLGTAAPRIGSGVRLFSFKRWVIIFRYDLEGIVILRIADGSQDYLSWKISSEPTR